MLKTYNFATGHWKKKGGPLKEFCYKNLPFFIRNLCSLCSILFNMESEQVNKLTTEIYMFSSH